MCECVKCGRKYLPRAPSCDACTWPLSSEAWSSTELRIRRITLDTTCVNVKRKNASLNKLEAWAETGHLELQRSDAMLMELRGGDRVTKAKALPGHPGLFRFGVSAFGGSDVLAGPDLAEDIRRILFPTVRDLTTNQIADIEHLRLHVRTGGDLFVTLNKNDFITRGRHDRLCRRGVWVFLPEEAVQLLRELYSWA